MSEIRAVRGGQLLNFKELQSYLALATKLENIGVLLGAGASKSAGGMLTGEIWTDFCSKFSESADWLKVNRFLTDSVASGSVVNLESLLDTIEIAISEWHRKDPNGEDLRELRNHRDNLYRSLFQAAILNREFWMEPNSVADHVALNNYRKLISRLIGSRQPGQPAPWVFTTNYDLAVEWSSESLGVRVINGFEGVHYRAFSPANFDLSYRNTLGRGEARFGAYHIYLAKLHGSLCWMPSEGFSVREVSTDVVWRELDEFIHGNSFAKEKPMILPNAAKYIQTVGFVYGELVRRLSEFLARTNGCLIISGYSFGDEHINRVLLTALQNPTFQLVIYLPELRFEGSTSKLISTTNRWITSLVESEHSQVTFVFGGERAYFEQFVRDLPEPALLDDKSERLRQLAKILERLEKNTDAGDVGLEGVELTDE